MQTWTDPEYYTHFMQKKAGARPAFSFIQAINDKCLYTNVRLNPEALMLLR